MFFVPESLFDTVLYIYPSVDDANVGTNRGGTGFIYSVMGADNRSPRHYFAVTNQHVAINARAIRMKRGDGTPFVWEIPEGSWIAHEKGDDIAVAHIPREVLRDVRCNGLRDMHLLERSNVVLHGESSRHYGNNAWIGQPCVLLGRIVEQGLQPNNTPVARFGTVSSISLDSFFVPETGRSQESLVVEVRSLSGYSGAAVIVSAPVPILLGINWGHLKSRQKIMRQSDDETLMPTGEVIWSNIGQAVVVPGWKLRELLDSDEVGQIRAAASASDMAR